MINYPKNELHFYCIQSHFIFRCLSQEQLVDECGIKNSIHRIRILNTIKGQYRVNIKNHNKNVTLLK